jgi:hypothetical protein
MVQVEHPAMVAMELHQVLVVLQSLMLVAEVAHKDILYLMELVERVVVVLAFITAQVVQVQPIEVAGVEQELLEVLAVQES